MSAEQSKDVVRKLLAKFGQCDVEGVIDMLTEDSTWWVGGKPDQFALAGPRTKEEISAILRGVLGEIPNGLEMRLRSMIAEGDTVAAEVESYGELNNGLVYNNEYHFLFNVRGEKISLAKEYLDTMHTNSIFLT
jgi:ketosteroid isomerase-like protein